LGDWNSKGEWEFGEEPLLLVLASLGALFAVWRTRRLLSSLLRSAGVDYVVPGGESARHDGSRFQKSMSSSQTLLVIAIDGPAASGKGTLARRIAEHYGLPHLDTGLTYRAVARALVIEDLPLDNEEIAEQAARNVDLSLLDRALLSAHRIGEAASQVAVMPGVRRVLVEKQRAFAATPPGAVLDGRDIGTVVCPDADVKLFVTASAEERARRRHAELAEAGGTESYEEVLADIQRRDERDMGRADSPLRPAEDAHLLDTSEMDIEAAFRAALDAIEAKRAAGQQI
jgi:cytidylate kinase